MDEAREGIVFFLVNNLPGASKLRALHYKRRNLAQVRAPQPLCFPHRQSYHLPCALLLWTDPGARDQRLFGSNVLSVSAQSQGQ